MPVIDCHTHAFPDAIAEKARESLGHRYGIVPSFDATISGLKGQMENVGVDVSIVLPVAMRPDQTESINRWVMSVKESGVVMFGALHPAHPEAPQQLRQLHQAGLKGVKFQPNWQQFRPDDPAFDPVYEVAQELRTILYFHCGDEVRKDLELLSTPASLRNVLDRFPGLNMVAAHMGGYLVWDETEQHLIGQNLTLDLAFCTPDTLPDDRLVHLARRHGTNRVIFGSDAPSGNLRFQLDRLRSLPLTPDELEDIQWRNAARLLNLNLNPQQPL